MSLPAGQRLGPYEIEAPIGAGGMGEVYRARDTRLGREVAIKVLPDAFARDPERLARFEREARVLASLNHPNIAAIYGFEQADGVPFLALEFVPGETLKGPLPAEDALAIATQIADALEEAHEKGVIHRDLKPANVKVTPDGKVKVLDFGLAKAFADETAEGDPSRSPTISIALTRGATLLGTAAYMSPEQARGRPLDRRTDTRAFGCVLYELLTGRRTFQGDTISDTLAAVLRAEPDWSAVPPTVPERVQYLLRRCLTKDPKARLRDIGEARVLIAEAGSSAAVTTVPPPAARRRLSWLPWAVAGLMAVVAAVAAWAFWQARQTPRPVIRAPITLPPGDRLPTTGFQPAMAFSADGSRLVYGAFRGARRQLFLRRMDQLNSVPIPGTDGADGPFFSPDGEWIGFFAEGKLKKILASGGVPLTLADAPSAWGASWGEDDTIVFAPSGTSGGLVRVSANGGVPQVLTTREEKSAGTHRWPQILPGGKAVLFTVDAPGSLDASRIVLLRLDTGELRTLVERAAYGRYVPTGHLVYARSGGLLAVPFNLGRLQVAGRHVPILEGVMTTGLSAVHLAFSVTGSLVYVPGGLMTSPKAVVWVDRKGAATEVTRTAAHAYWARVSPDGRRIAISIVDAANTDVWIFEPARDTLRRLTFGPGVNCFPVWMPDGKRLVFASNRTGAFNLYWKAADGSGVEEQLTDSPNYKLPSAVSPDGKWLAFYETAPATGADIWLLPLKGERKPKPFLQTQFSEGEGRFSPDGRWLAYVSADTGRAEVYVQPFPEGTSKGKWLISSGGGREPVWSPSGRELFYRNGNQVMAVDVTPGASFVAGKPRLLFEGQYFGPAGFLNLDVSPDGKRFLMLKETSPDAALSQFNLVVNWFEELKQRVK